MASTGKPLSICAVIAARNEFPYLKILLPLLAGQDIDVAIIDNDSTDGSRELYSDFMGDPIVAVESLPYHGYFSLSEQLAAKQKLLARIEHDWVIHHDADEIMEHREPGLSLRDAIQGADEAGYNVVNFDEFVFLPEPGADYFGRDYYAELLRYYFFRPRGNRLNRAWKRKAQLDNARSGGHNLEGNVISVAPVNHILRHYIVLSEDHARSKYLTRIHDPRELDVRWHRNRRDFTSENLRLPDESDFLFLLERGDPKAFRRDRPAPAHFWEWEDEPRQATSMGGGATS